MSARWIRRIPLGVAALAATMVAAAPANASQLPVSINSLLGNLNILTSGASSCSSETFTQPFAKWLDYDNYALMPGGTFESGQPAWTVTGGAAVSAGNETYYAHSTKDTQSMSLPTGSTATSPGMCVGITSPSARLFVKNTGSASSTLNVSVLYDDASGNLHTLSIANLTGTSSWQPSPPILIVANLLPLLPGNETDIDLKFTPQGTGGGWHIDDVYVDPWVRG